MSRRRPRGLRADEKELWERVAKTATPLSDRKPMTKPDPPREQATADAPPTALDKPPLPKFRIGSKAGEPAFSPLSRSSDSEPVRMDRKQFDKMRRGKATPDGRIDLHGMTADTARSALVAYVLTSHARGKRLILVITGKGRARDDDGPIPARQGVLRQSLPHWLQTPPLSSVVLQVAPAHQRHGGSGAFYVYLRRPR